MKTTAPTCTAAGCSTRTGHMCRKPAPKLCPRCGGMTLVYCPVDGCGDDCMACGGTGQVTCPRCKGEGEIAPAVEVQS